MASGTPRTCCATGFKHEGTPDGETRLIDNVPAYFAYPKDNETPEKAIILISDVFGIVSNSQLLADDFASNGYLTVIPDIFAGDPLNFGDYEARKVNFPEWLAKHPVESVDPVIEATIKHLRENLSMRKVVAVGYCFGGKYVARFLKNGNLDAGYVAHPSLLTHKELGAIEKPFSIAAAETDDVFTTQLRHESEEILIKTGQPYQINLFGGVQHGFAVRGDLSKPLNKYAKEQAFVQAVAWFNCHVDL